MARDDAAGGPESGDPLREAAENAVAELGEWRGAPPAVRASADNLEQASDLRAAAERTVDSLSTWSSAPPEIRKSITGLERALKQADEAED